MPEPVILYLHGVGRKVRSDAWLDSLNTSLESQGLEPRVLRRDVVAPDFVDLLDGATPPKLVGGDSRSTLDRDRARAARPDFMREKRRLSELLTVGVEPPSRLPSSVAEAGRLTTQRFNRELRHAEEYRRKKDLRACIRERVLSAIGDHRDLVVIAHSLGSLVAIDVLPYLHPKLRVRRLITIGSPAGWPGLHRGGSRPREQFPYDRVQSWVNMLSPRDLVTLGRGLSGLFPAALDVRIALAPGLHGAEHYLLDELMALALADAVRGHAATAATSTRGIEARLDEEERAMAFGVSFGREVAAQIDDPGTRKRYAAALDDVQVSLAHRLVSLRHLQLRPVPAALNALASGEDPGVDYGWDRETALNAVVFAAMTSQVRPYDIDVDGPSVAAIPAAWERLGLSAEEGERIADAHRRVRRVLESPPWRKVAAGATGLAALATGPVGLLAAGGAGLAGSATLTSALATFGPGGMVGGMVLAGSLAGVGTAMTGGPALLPDRATEGEVLADLIRRLTVSSARVALGLEVDHGHWFVIVEMESHLAEQLSDIEHLSDPRSPTVRSLTNKVTMVRRALAWLVDQHLAPALLTEDPDGPAGPEPTEDDAEPA